MKQNKYRIIKVEKGDFIHYELQVKRFIGWTTEKEINCYPIGAPSYVVKFNSIEEVNDYYKKYYSKEKRTIVF